MPITIKTNEIKVKDRSTGEYTKTINVIAEQTNAEIIAELNSVTAELIEEVENTGEDVLESIPEDYTDLSNAVEELIPLVYNSYPNETIYGDLITIEDGAQDIPLKDLYIDINPIQNMNGYDKPWPAGGGKNKLPAIPIASLKSLNTTGIWNGNVYTESGVTFTPVLDGNGEYTGEVKTSGTASANVNFFVLMAEASTFAGMILNGAPSGGSGKWEIDYTLQSSPYSGWAYDTGSGSTIDASASGTSILFILVNSGKDVSDLTFRPMIRHSSVSDATFAPYENLCLISGWSSLDLYHSGKNLLDALTLIGTTDYAKVGMYLMPGSYAFSYSGSNCDEITIRTGSSIDGSTIATANNNNKIIFNITVAGTYSIRCYKSEGWTASGVTAPSSPQLEISASVTSYEDYQGEKYTIDFPLSFIVYNGKYKSNGDLDRTSAIWHLTKDESTIRSIAVIGTGENQITRFWVFLSTDLFIIYPKRTEILSDQLTLTDYADAVVGFSVSYSYQGALVIKLPTIMVGTTVETIKAYLENHPITFLLPRSTAVSRTVDAVSIKTLYGLNYIWTNCGNIHLDYRADTALYIDKKLNS